MKTIETKVYEYDELSDAAKERAREWYRNGTASNEGYSWADDAIASLKALAEHFGGKLSEYSIDFFNCSHSDASFDMPELDHYDIATRLTALGSFNPETLCGHGDCKLTGYCADEDAIDGFRKAWHAGERDLGKLMKAAFDTWLKAAQADCEYQFGDEQIAETIRANEYTFTEDGKRF